MNIVICDNDEFFLESFYIRLKKYLEQKDIQFDIVKFTDGNDLLRMNIYQVDVIFLDIQLTHLNGIEIAAELRKYNDKFVLIFISGFIEYAVDGYRVNALRYILKGQLDIHFDDMMETVFESLGYKKNQISFPFVNGEVSTYIEEIVYIESKLHSLYFHMCDGKVYRLYEKLTSIQMKLPEKDFIRIHQSYLVNYRYFLDAKNYNATLAGGIVLPIAQRSFANVKNKLFLYRGKA